MKRALVKYKVYSDRAEEKTDYIQKVFSKLQQNSPDGLRYASFKLEDGVSFVHIGYVETESGFNPSVESLAFASFQENKRSL